MSGRARAAVVGLGCALLLARARDARADDASDPWFGQDKALHFGVSAGLAAGGYAAGAALFEARGHALLFGGGLALGAGVGKELVDLAGYGDPSWKDLAWDGIGTVVGLLVAWGLDAALRGIGPAQPLLEAPR